jgi:hypothetical protein
MFHTELGKPYMLLRMRYLTARERNGIEGRRKGLHQQHTLSPIATVGKTPAPQQK